MEMELRRIREAAFRELELAQEVGALNENPGSRVGEKGRSNCRVAWHGRYGCGRKTPYRAIGQ